MKSNNSLNLLSDDTKKGEPKPWEIEVIALRRTFFLISMLAGSNIYLSFPCQKTN